MGKLYFFKKVKEFFSQRIGLCILCFLLLGIIIASIKPDLYLIGWDNYSSYFNLPTNIFRTFFATWREHRGLGVPSDSEVTDIFRQGFYILLSPFIKETLLDQVYILFALSVGVFSMYAFCYSLLKRYGGNIQGVKWADALGFFGAFFYLFNLNTLATFYFPIIPYINRFFSLPLLFLLFFIYSNKPTLTKKDFIIFGLIAIFTSGTYITATVFITFFLVFSLFGIFQENKKRILVLIAFYTLLQAFWLLPFFNYTINKSNLIRLAPTFINANESQLNKPESFYTLDKQLVVFPSFFYTEFYDITGVKKTTFHPLSTNYQKFPYNIILFIFPLSYVLGAAILIIKYKKYKRLLWLPITLFLFLFLSMKEFSYLGFIYHFLDNTTPYFGVLFRFGDTKFHPVIAYMGSIMASVALVYFIYYGKRIITSITICLLFFSTLFVFSGYYRGHFIGPFIYNKIPDGYFSIAKIINEDKGYFRVLHLPFSKEDYWKSYTWGAVGSSFFHYMIDKPFIDKTFEPGSMENADLNKQINDILANMQSIKTQDAEEQKVREFASLLKKTGVKYIIADETVQPTIYSRGISLWGRFNTTEMTEMMRVLERYKVVTKIQEYTVSLDNYPKFYEFAHILTDQEKKILKQNKRAKLTLFQIKEPQQKITFLSNTTNVDPEYKSLLTNKLNGIDEHWIEPSLKQDYVFFPFQQANMAINTKKNEYSFSFKESQYRSPLQQLVMEYVPLQSIKDSNKLRYLDIYATLENKKLSISLSLRRFPQVKNELSIIPLKTFEVSLDKVIIDTSFKRKTEDYISDWAVLPTRVVGPLRLQIGNYIIPLPYDITQNTYAGTVAIEGTEVQFSLLGWQKTKSIDLSEFRLTDNPNCFADKLQDSFYEVKQSSSLNIISKNQSTCLSIPLHFKTESVPDHAEFVFSLKGENKDLDKKYNFSYANTTKPVLKDIITSLKKPNLLRFCGKESLIDTCYNLHQFINVEENTHAIFPFEKPLLGNPTLNLLLSVKNTGYQYQKISIQSLDVDEFKKITEGKLLIPEDKEKQQAKFFKDNSNLVLSFPKVLSPYSFFFRPEREGLYGYNDPCKTGGYKTVRLLDKQMITYIENCSVDFFQQMPFSSDNFLFWVMPYNLASGKFPRFIVNDAVHSYVDEYVSLGQGYPDVSGFKQLQSSEMWYQRLFDESLKTNIQNTLKKLPLENSYGYMHSEPGILDQKEKNILFHQDSENEGILVVGEIGIQPLPTDWSQIRVSSNNALKNYDLPNKYTFKQISPSLWKVTVSLDTKKQYLLFFNEGYDRQWKLFDSFISLFVDKGEESKRCDGYANCFSIAPTTNSDTTFYIFYTPERLSFLGWLTTCAVFVFSFTFVYKKFLIKK